MTKTVLIVATILTFLTPIHANAQQQQQQQQFRELDREYEEAKYMCKLIVGEPGTWKRWQAVMAGINPQDCIAKRLGLRKPGQSVDVNVNRH